MVKDITRIEIPNFITHVVLSKKRRAKHYKKGNKRPNKYSTSDYVYNKDDILVHKITRVPVIANPRSVGTPRIKKINGQDIYRGNTNPHMRSKIVSEMKDFFRKELRKQKVKPIPTEHYPLEMELEMCLPLSTDFDVDNASWLYVKVIQDVLTDCGVIRNDVAILLPKTGGTQYVPLEDGEERQLNIILRENHTPFREKLKKYVTQEKIDF